MGLLSQGLKHCILWNTESAELFHKKPSFLASLFAILILISVNFADFITGFLNVSHKTLTSHQNDYSFQCGHAPAIMSIVAASGLGILLFTFFMI